MTSSPDNIARFTLAKSAAKKAGDVALEYFRNRDRLRIEEKTGGQDMVSQADREVEAIIRAEIREHFPDDGIIGEEYGVEDGAAAFTWVIDPIDGTSPFVSGIPAWCISIAIVSGRRHVAGIIYAPCTGELYSALAGAGATMNEVPIKVSATMTIADGILGVGANHRVPAVAISDFVRRLLERGGMFTRNGSGALMLAYVAAGRLAGYYEPHINAWDCLAGLCLVREAGGWTNDFLEDFDFDKGGPVIAASPGTRDDLLGLIGEDVPTRGRG